MNHWRILIIVCSMLLFNCVNDQKRNIFSQNDASIDTPVYKRNEHIVAIDNSINGNVKYAYPMDGYQYTYDQFGNILKSVFKDSLMTENHKILINSDSVYVGQIFSSEIWWKEDNYRIDIKKPIERTVSSDEFENYYFFEYRCKTEGTYEFEGQIVSSFDSVRFNYKFVVSTRQTH